MNNPQDNARIGIGIVTCNREEWLLKLYHSLPHHLISSLIIVNDGKELSSKTTSNLYLNDSNCFGYKIHDAGGKKVGYCKNVCMRHLLDEQCDYIFTLEDDIYLDLSNSILFDYINASKATGIQHFNFGFSQRENLRPDGSPIIRKTIDYPDGTKIVLTPNVLGALTFYTRKALLTIGLHHEKFDQCHGDHPELTYRAWKHGFHPPFWWFADIDKSWEKVKNLSDMSTSIVRNQEQFAQNFQAAQDNFKFLHGHTMIETPHLSEQEALKTLRRIYINHAHK